MPPVPLFLLQAAIIIGLPYGLWHIGGLRRWAPLAVVQIAVGLALGPSVLGQFQPQWLEALFPSSSLAMLDGLVWLGICFFAFATGLHFDVAEFRGRGGAFALTSVSTLALPTLAGTAAGWWLVEAAPGAVAPGVPPWAFAAGIGIAVGVTALPVLAAVLREMNLLDTPLGAEALGCAVVNDAGLWLMMALLLAAARGGGAEQALLIVAQGAAYAALLWLVIRPVLSRLSLHAEAERRVGERDVVMLSVGMFVSAWITESIGLHALIGAFAFGAVVPKAVARQVLARVDPFLTVVLLPFFFMATGLKTSVESENGAYLVFAIATVVSVLSKFLAACLPARLCGWAWRDSLALGALVGCKGLMELAVLTLLLDSAIVSHSGFSAMVLMALATTALAGPLAKLILRH